MFLLITASLSWALIFALLALLAVTDIRSYLLPNRLVAALAITIYSFHISTHWQFLSVSESLIGLIAGGGFLLVVRTIANKVTKTDALGLGDVKFMGASGLLLGFPGIFLALSLGAFLGIFHGVLLQYLENARTGKKPPLATVNVPAGAGLALGVALVALYQIGFWWQK